MLPYPLRQLDELCRAHPLQRKVLIVPALRAGYNLISALARCGGSWTNLRVATPVQHALERIRPAHPAAAVRRLDQEGRRGLLEAVLAGPAGDGIRPSTPAAAAGLAEALRRTIDDLRAVGKTSEQVDQSAPGPSFSDLGALYAAYSRELLAQDWWDDARILVTAIDAVETGDAHPPAVWMIADETEMPPLALRYVLAVSEDRLHRIGRDSYGVPAPAYSAAVRCAAAPVPGKREATAPRTMPRPAASPGPGRAVPSCAPHVQGDLFLDHLRTRKERSAPARRPGPPSPPSKGVVEVAPGGRLFTEGLRPADRDRIRLWRTIGMETEIRAVLRDVLARGIPLDEVEIAYTRGDPYRFLLFDAVERWELQADFTAGVPVEGTRPGRALTAFLAWIRGGLDGLDLARSLRCGDLGWEDPEASPSEVAHLLLTGRVGKGPEAGVEALDRVEGGEPDPADLEPREAAAVERRLARLRRARLHLKRLHAWIPHGPCSLASMAGAAGEFLKGPNLTRRDVASDRDRLAREVMTARLREISRGPELTGSPAEQAGRLLESMRRLSVDGARASPGRLHVAPLDGAGYACRRHLYVIGLDEAHFPGSRSGDPMLSDESRRALGLPTERSRAGDAVFQLIRVLGAAPGEVTLVASSLHLADGREPYPTPLFELAARQLEVDPCWRWPLPAEPEAAGADDLEIFLSHRGRPGYREAVASSYRDADRGARVQEARAGSAPSRFDGWIDAPGEQALDLQGERVLSSRMLETLAACPRRYLLRDVLRVRALEEPGRDSRRWLQPLEMGELLHDLFLEYMRRLGDRRERPSVEHEEEVARLVAGAIDRWRGLIPAPLEAAFRNDRRRIERASRIFLLAEAQRLEEDPALTPRYLEWDFGGGEGVEISLSPQVAFRLRGRMDRVDQVEGSGRYEIWDYKTGSTWGYDPTDLLAGGRNLQWALYALALPLLEAGEVRRSGYFLASDRGSGQRFADAPPGGDQVANLLGPLFGLAREGFFPALHKGDKRGGGPCRFCDYRRICASEARGEDHIGDQTEAAAQATALVEGWAEAVSTGRSQSRRALEAQLATLGLEPADVVPVEAVTQAEDWMTA